ncbi:ABC transporter substrate-binding protein [Brachybacterium phenoliresistens]|uniref:ABC transporter substrate-binding protein n=1 Tax=Brachybacterium phenoliresistens TaxID=396014 RepID=Z9JQN1_9MICO|nr:ABC transporter substrate-binding protein [Brachybacterium phenoliresistens]EWS80091.1 ABC transporter substrate-binding protein [Brachybacterium phenoliresistens]
MLSDVRRRSLLTGGAVLTLSGLGLSACSGSNSGPGDGPAEPFPTAWDDALTADVFDGLANQMGEQPGWFGKLVTDRFNLTLNVIAPNVAGGGDTLYNTRVSAGDLGDIVLTDQGQKLTELVEGGLLMDISSWYEHMESSARFDAAVQKVNEGLDGIYAIPTQVSTLKPSEPSEGIDPTFGPFVRWDVYGKVGYPEIGTLEDLLPVLKQMQDAEPTAANGKRTYALSLFADWDGNYMNNAKQPCCYYGYDEVGFVLAKADGSDFQSILDPGSLYVRVLKWFFEANQLGILDPESTTQNYDTLFSKMQAGQVLFSFWPWQGQAAFNTEANMAEGKGFMIAPLADQKIFSYGASVYGGKQVFGVGSNAEDPARGAAFIDWLYSSEGVYANSSQTMGAAGPQGLTWELNADGKPELTDFGRQVLLGEGGNVPEEWGGGSYIDGTSWLNVTTVIGNDEDPETGFPFNYKMWETYQATAANPLTEDWAGRMGGHATTMEYLQANDMLAVGAGASYVAPEDSSEISTIRNQVKAVIVESSWKMAFAKDQAEFDALLAEMQSTADGLGYQQVLEVDMANAKDQDALRKEVVAEFG